MHSSAIKKVCFDESCFCPMDADKIIEWINANNVNLEHISENKLLVLIEALFKEIYPSISLDNGMALAWIRGDSYQKISNDFEIKTYDVERISQYNISYQMSFLVGNVIDLADTECVNLEALSLLQCELRYGVNTRTAVSICEKIFNDRYLAKLMASIIGDSSVANEDIISIIKKNRERILLLLNDYPDFFANVIKSV